MTNYYSIHGLVSVQSDIDLSIPTQFSTDAVADPDITVTVEPLPVDVPRHAKKQRDGYAVWKHDDALVIDYEVLNLKLLVGGLDGSVRISCTEQFAKRRMNHVGVLVKLALQLKLIDQGYCFIHAGCIATEDSAIVIPALGSTGKTYTTLSLVDGNTRFYLSDDLALIGRDGSVYSYPTSANTGPYVLENEAVPEFESHARISDRLAEIPVVSLLYELFPWLYPSNRIEPPQRVIKDTASLGAVCLITNGTQNEAAPISSDEATRRTLIQHFDTHGLFQNFALNYYSYLFDYDLTARTTEMRSILSAAFTEAQCYELRSNDLHQYPELIKQISTDL